MIKKKPSFPKTLEIHEIIASMKVAATNAESNFRNKLDLLEAEHYGISSLQNGVTALHAYDNAIASARKSKFVHEEGLACEKAGFYCQMNGDNENARAYFNRARDCYEKWGSTVKIEFIQKELSKLNITGQKP